MTMGTTRRALTTAVVAGLAFGPAPVVGQTVAAQVPAQAAEVNHPVHTTPPDEDPNPDGTEGDGGEPADSSGSADSEGPDTTIATPTAPPTDEPTPDPKKDGEDDGESGLKAVKPTRIVADFQRDAYAARKAQGKAFGNGEYFEVPAGSNRHYFVTVNGALRHFNPSQYKAFKSALEKRADGTSTGVEVLNSTELGRLAKTSGALTTHPSEDTLVVEGGAVKFIAGTSLRDYKPTPSPTPSPSTPPSPKPSPIEPSPNDELSPPDDTPSEPKPESPDNGHSDEPTDSTEKEASPRSTDESGDHQGHTLDPSTGNNAVPVQAGEDWPPESTGDSGNRMPNSNDYSDPVPGAPGSEPGADAIVGPAPNDSASEESSAGAQDSSDVESQQSFGTGPNGFPWALAGLVTLGVGGAALAVIVVARRQKADS